MKGSKSPDKSMLHEFKRQIKIQEKSRDNTPKINLNYSNKLS